MLEEKGLGVIRKESIKILSERINRVFKKFKLPGRFTDLYLNMEERENEM